MVRTIARKLPLLTIGRTIELSSLSSSIGPAAEAFQRGEAGAEVIEGELDPGLRQLREERWR